MSSSSLLTDQGSLGGAGNEPLTFTVWLDTNGIANPSMSFQKLVDSKSHLSSQNKKLFHGTMEVCRNVWIFRSSLTHDFLKLQDLFNVAGFRFWPPAPAVHNNFLLSTDLHIIFIIPLWMYLHFYCRSKRNGINLALGEGARERWKKVSSFWWVSEFSF